MENVRFTDCQRSIAKTGYTCLSDWVDIAVDQGCQHVNTDLGVIPLEPWALKMVLKQIANAASQNQDILLFLTRWKLLSMKIGNTSTLIWGTYLLNPEHGKYCIRRLSTQHRKNRIYYFLWPGDNCCHLRMSTRQHWFGGHTPWTLSIENGVKADCQRSITKSGYTSVSY